MTNEEKAKKIADSVFSLGFNTNRTFYDMAVNTAVAIAEWKDSQPQIIEIFGKRVKAVKDNDNTADGCMKCTFIEVCQFIELCQHIIRGNLCQSADKRFKRHFVEVD